MHCGVTWNDQLIQSLMNSALILQVGTAWHVVVRKGHRVVNKTGQPLHILRGHAAIASTAICTDMMHLKSQEVSSNVKQAGRMVWCLTEIAWDLVASWNRAAGCPLLFQEKDSDVLFSTHALHVAGWNPNSRSDARNAVMQASAQELLVCRTTDGAEGLESTCIYVWLGTGWSQALYLADFKAQVKLFRQQLSMAAGCT